MKKMNNRWSIVLFLAIAISCGDRAIESMGDAISDAGRRLADGGKDSAHAQADSCGCAPTFDVLLDTKIDVRGIDNEADRERLNSETFSTVGYHALSSWYECEDPNLLPGDPQIQFQPADGAPFYTSPEADIIGRQFRFSNGPIAHRYPVVPAPRARLIANESSRTFSQPIYCRYIVLGERQG